MARRLVYDLFHGLDNTLYGDDNVNGDEIRGGDGDDKLFGVGGDDLLLGGNDDDSLFGGQGNDIVRGNAGNDTMFMDRGNNTFEGGGDTDTLDFSHIHYTLAGGGYSHQIQESIFGFNVDLESGVTLASTQNSAAFTDSYGTNSFDSIEVYNLTNNKDILRGDDSSDFIQARGGDDLVEGRGGADTIHGGAGVNTASYESSPHAVDVDLSRGAGQQLGGDAAGDVLSFMQNLIGSGHADFLTGDSNANRIEGGGGADEITGGGGHDVLHGGLGADFFIYRDVLDSVGSLNQRDVIEDFQRDAPGRVVGDTIDLHAIDANVRPGQGGNQDFRFIGTDAFTGAGQVRVSFQDNEGNPYTLVQAEVTGDGRADFTLTVFTNNDTLLSREDFLL